MSMATQQPIESINPSDIGLDISECEAALDALTDMEDDVADKGVRHDCN